MATMQATQTGTSYQLADPADVRKLLDQYPTSVKPLEAGDVTPHPALNGKRVVLRLEERKSPEDNAIYFVWRDGSKCLIPDAETFNALFSTAEGVIALSRKELGQITTGEALTSGAVIARPRGKAPHYLVSNKEKHYITNPNVMAYCKFRNAEEVLPILLDFIPPGFNIDYGE